MKRLKHLLMTGLILVLAVSMIIGGAGLSAFAYTAPQIAEHATVNLPASVKLGSTFDVDSTKVIVRAPNGVIITPKATTTDEYVADMLGNYTIKYYDVSVNLTDPSFDEESVNPVYTQNINCRFDGEYELRVEDGGAAIPTYIKAGNSIPLPKAHLYAKDDETGEFKIADEQVDVKIYLNSVLVTDPDNVTFSIGRNIVQYVGTFKANVGSTETPSYVTTKKFFTKEFEVKAQTNFSDTVRPTLSISGMPTEASLNTKVTLPKATATDNYDQNVYVKIEVKQGNDVVKEVTLDKYSYADLANTPSTAKAVRFDNAYNLSFYPTTTGDYTVTYQAFDDNNNESVKHTHTVRVLDKSAPKLEKIADDQIPSTWALTINNEATKDQTPAFIESQKINFPFPEYSDNSGKDGIQVSFEIKDTVNNLTVVRFDDIYDLADGGNTYTKGTASKGYYDGIDTNTGAPYYLAKGGTVTFDKDNGFDFYLALYTQQFATEDNKTFTGRYTATYQARDSRPNITTKSYDITVQDKLEDIAAPNFEAPANDYLFVESNTVYQEYTLPTVTVSDTYDSKPTVTYKISNVSFESDPRTNALDIVVENGAKIEIKKNAIKYDGVEYKYGVASVTEAGKETTLALDDLYISIFARDNVFNSVTKYSKIQLAHTGDTDVTLSIAGTLKNTVQNDQQIIVGEPANLGDLVINSFETTHRRFAGFELILTNPDGDEISGMSFETYVKNNGDGTKRSIYVDDITFTPARASEATKPYKLTVRAFDVSGKSLIRVYAFYTNTVVSGGDPGIVEASTPIPSTPGSVNVQYKLQNETARVSTSADRPYISRRISDAGRFSLIGSEFTAMSAGKYAFSDGYYIDNPRYVDNVTTPNEDEYSFISLSPVYHLNATETSNPAFELLTAMPNHAKISTATNPEPLRLPEIVAFNDYANADIKVTVKSPLRTLDNNLDLTSNGGNSYTLYPTENGEYTITYTASVNGANEVTQTYRIRVGDIVAPTFSVKNAAATDTEVQEKYFKFKEIEIAQVDNPDDDLEKITYTKVLIDPNGDPVYEVKGTGAEGRKAKTKSDSDEGYKLTKTGNYTIKYSATDKHGNTSDYFETLNVTGTGTVSNVPLKVVRTLLIILGIVLIAGVGLYIFRYSKFRRNKTAK